MTALLADPVQHGHVDCLPCSALRVEGPIFVPILLQAKPLMCNVLRAPAGNAGSAGRAGRSAFFFVFSGKGQHRTHGPAVSSMLGDDL